MGNITIIHFKAVGSLQQTLQKHMAREYWTELKIDRLQRPPQFTEHKLVSKEPKILQNPKKPNTDFKNLVTLKWGNITIIHFKASGLYNNKHFKNIWPLLFTGDIGQNSKSMDYNGHPSNCDGY
ncbi:hypothetical protein CEXT_783121 [Caerostris extrusa]|uniref:Uncharacterized protein n=1 Tax=Caerostris extrusa TaxID=172846 RepID=A0AAV4ME30_CAEEX|nr:hypothetical protein CEXT_783121 [Caerostris extrusa]